MKSCTATVITIDIPGGEMVEQPASQRPDLMTLFCNDVGLFIGDAPPVIVLNIGSDITAIAFFC